MHKAERLVADGGYGHTSSLYIDAVTETEKIDDVRSAHEDLPYSRQYPLLQGGIGDLYNFKLTPSLTLGCGSWGGNSVSENVGVKHLLNIKTVAERRENMLWFRAPQKVYFKKGCLPVALDELKNVMGKKQRLHCHRLPSCIKNGYTKPITDQLDEMGIVHTTFFDVAPDPTLACAQEGAARHAGLPAGLSSSPSAAAPPWTPARSCGSCMSIPEVDFMDMAMRFMDIRKRVYTFPKMGEKAYFIAVPTSAGTGSEVTPFAVITDEDSRRQVSAGRLRAAAQHGHRGRRHDDEHAQGPDLPPPASTL